MREQKWRIWYENERPESGNGEFGMKIKEQQCWRIWYENECLREAMESLIVLFQATNSQ